MIREISSSLFKEFLGRNRASEKQVSVNVNGVHYGYFTDKLIGVISINDTINTRRVKGFLVNEEYQNRGVGSELLNYVLVDKRMTTFATKKSVNLFLSVGFRVRNKLKNNIKFLER